MFSEGMLPAGRRHVFSLNDATARASPADTADVVCRRQNNCLAIYKWVRIVAVDNRNDAAAVAGY